MKSMMSFIRTTLTGGIMFLLPLALLLILSGKAFEILFKISAPISKRLPTIIFGLNGSNIVAIILLIFLCFLGGLIFRSAFAKKIVVKIEENILNNIPGYALVKSMTADTIGEKIDNSMSPILIKDGDSWSPGFLVEEGNDVSTVFIPEAPRHNAGEIKIISTELVKKLDVSTIAFSRCIKNYGKGLVNWMD